MRITKIKLAGFKSFVDPTTLHLPGNLTGVVGPNGCGKSNIIDALMWVMGEMSAKHLRGDSMADVIFSGSSSRKPVGLASVELVFDNSDGAIGGQYASFGEISIKRTVARDAISTYMLNGVRCRRKDIVDVFLGTGLGTRGGYSVIEQGMISRVVEAKPEELRGFLEEAAGISRYKERRRETESRIRHTNENLERVNDIREELDKQLAHLQRQANAAEKYQELKADERRTDAELLAIRWRAIDASRAAQRQQLLERENAVEAALADLRRLESEQAARRATQTRALEEFNGRQSDFYGKSADISRLEQSLQHNEERRLALAQDLQRARYSLTEAGRLLEADAERLREIEAEAAALSPGLDERAQGEDLQAEELRRVEAETDDWQRDWDRFNTQQAETARLEHAEKVRLELLEAGSTEARRRMHSLRNEQAGLSTATVEERIAALRAELRAGERLEQALLAEQEQLRSELRRARQDVQTAGVELHAARSTLERLLGQQASLKALQDAALGRDQRSLTDWLAVNGLAEAKVLAAEMAIESGWERAVETALKVPLGALCGEGLVEQLLSVEAGAVPVDRLAAIAADPPVASIYTLAGVPRLIDRMRCPWSLASLLAGIYVADDLAAATALRGRLAAHESVITPAGVWLGPNWVQIPGPDAAQAGILARERTLEGLARQHAELREEVEARQQALEGCQKAMAELERRDQQLTQDLHGTMSRTGELKSQTARHESEFEQVSDRMVGVEAELSDLARQAQHEESALAAIREAVAGMQLALLDFDRRREALAAQRRDLQARLDRARTAWREAREARHALALKLEAARSTQASLALAIGRNTHLREELTARVTDLEAAIASAAEPQLALHEQLDQALAARIACEQALKQSRQLLDELEQGLRLADEGRSHCEREITERQRALEQVRLEDRALQVRAQELVERLEQAGTALETVLAELPADASEAAWHERLASLANRINRLGPINLAAIDEFAQLSERKTYLDYQYGDLTQALATLEDAMRKIDKETRTRFKETFDKVNAGLQSLFPILFGGGHAYLELTGDDLLETGIAVMARPPGKRNSTIHLLSGGEKALTALAFVFSLFELNPAPFCLLDEVDAPLDDANVIRLTEMLKSMAERVQFLFVTHNKITMEIAEQLIGVTMQEAGVSRLVSVNMEEAVALAATA